MLQLTFNASRQHSMLFGVVTSLPVIAAALMLGSCERIQQVRVLSPATCGELIARRSALVAKREITRAEMEHDTDLGLHSVPGQSLDTAGLRDAQAYVRRVRERWREDDSRMAHALSETEAALQADACRGS